MSLLAAGHRWTRRALKVPSNSDYRMILRCTSSLLVFTVAAFLLQSLIFKARTVCSDEAYIVQITHNFLTATPNFIKGEIFRKRTSEETLSYAYAFWSAASVCQRRASFGTVKETGGCAFSRFLPRHFCSSRVTEFV